MKSKSKPQRTLRYRRVHKEKTLFPLRSLLLLCGNVLGFLLFFSSTSYSQSNKFGGIGVSVDIDSSVMRPYIVDILSGKPGAMAGLRSGDHIISINHWNTKGKSQEQVANKLRGRVGSQVDIAIDRGGKEMDFEMKREQIVVNEKAGNLCEGLDKVLKIISDNFHDSIGNPYYNMEKFKNIFDSINPLPGFDNSNIYGAKQGRYYMAYYFIGKDTMQAINQYKKLISKILDCLPYTIVSNFKSFEILNQGSKIWTYFSIYNVNNHKYNNIRKWEINIIREIESDQNYSVKILINRPLEH